MEKTKKLDSIMLQICKTSLSKTGQMLMKTAQKQPITEGF